MHRFLLAAMVLTCGGFAANIRADEPASPAPDELKSQFSTSVQPLLRQFCLDCHSTADKKGSLDLERFRTVDDIRKSINPWQQTIEMLEAGEMPPKDKRQPTAAERQRLIAWIQAFLDAEARARSGDPGYVPLRRLSNAEYDLTIRDLTGVDLRPTREFPPDGAAGEGFTNAAEALADISPTLLTKYLNAAKDVAAHAVLLPDGFRFSTTTTRRDWTDESTARLRKFYAEFTADGRLAVTPYLSAVVRHRESLAGGRTTLAEIAAKERLNLKYLGVLWETLNDKKPSQPLDTIRARWRAAEEKDVPALAAEVAAWQTALWKFVAVGSYRFGDSPRQVANDPAAAETATVKLSAKPAPGQAEVVLYLCAREAGAAGPVVWRRPRFEAPGKPPLMLRDYAEFGPAFEVDYAAVFADSAKYLAAAAEGARSATKVSTDDLAKQHGLDASLLQRWIETAAIEPLKPPSPTEEFPAKNIPFTALEPLDELNPPNDKQPWIKGWRRRGADLPVVVSNAGNELAMIPGRLPPHRVAVHPLPKEFVAVAWKSPFARKVILSAHITHAHPACGNGVAWRIEHRRGERVSLVADGALDLGADIKVPGKSLVVAEGDTLLLVVDARKGEHTCDLTEVAFTLTEDGPAKRVWDLAADVADSIHEGNPHADQHGHKAVWSFVKGPSIPTSDIAASASKIPGNSLLGRWRNAAGDPARRSEAESLGMQVQKLLSGPRPTQDKDPDQIAFDYLVNSDGVLLKGLDLTRFAKARPAEASYGLPRDRFGRRGDGPAVEDNDLAATADSVVEIRLPAALLREREFVVEGSCGGPVGERIVQFQVTTSAPVASLRWDGKSPLVASAQSAAYRKIVQGNADFRRVFPWYLCFPNVVPTDEVVSLKMFHREDEPLLRLLLDDESTARLERLWAEHRFISKQAPAENDYLPQFIGFVTQDQPKELLAYFESQRPVFQQRADAWEQANAAAVPRQLDRLLDFTARAFRRPLTDKERTDLPALYHAVRKNGADHEEAFRGVLTRVLVSPEFLYRIERAPPGTKAGPVSDWELAVRLSSFFWSSLPDDELRSLAAAGKLREPRILSAQTERMLKDDRVRALAIEFGTQWLHVRGFDELKEKNEALFPSFDATLRTAIYEESILFFQHLFQADRPVTDTLDADYTFLNETLAKHYAVPGVTGPQWRRVEGVRKFGRGGILGLASVQAKQSGASRTSPVLRGNWVVETLLGEKLPRPPANVPQLPEAEGSDGLTTRQLVEMHTRVQECAGCHVRIDPFGFAFEHYDPIGRRREKDLTGVPLDARAELKDGTKFEGLDGLRTYLLTKKHDVVVRLFCRKLLGYGLGRAVTLSDQPLLDEMVAELKKADGKISAAVQCIVRSPQFLMIRGSDYAE